MAESTAIVEYISQRYGDGKLSASASDPDYPHYLYWMQFNNNLQSCLFIKLAVQSTGIEPAADNVMMTTTLRREVTARPAYQKAMNIAGPGAVRPDA